VGSLLGHCLVVCLDEGCRVKGLQLHRYQLDLMSLRILKGCGGL